MKTNIILSTDGSCKGNPGPGGYCGILRYKDKELEVAGYEPNATNNRMELKAVIEPLRRLKRPCNVTVETDSHYVCLGIAKVAEWERNGWKLRSGATPKNVDLWKEYQSLTTKGNHSIHYQYTKGHAGDEYNERCDKIAKSQIELHTKGA